MFKSVWHVLNLRQVTKSAQKDVEATGLGPAPGPGRPVCRGEGAWPWEACQGFCVALCRYHRHLFPGLAVFYSHSQASGSALTYGSFRSWFFGTAAAGLLPMKGTEKLQTWIFPRLEYTEGQFFFLNKIFSKSCQKVALNLRMGWEHTLSVLFILTLERELAVPARDCTPSPCFWHWTGNQVGARAAPCSWVVEHYA